MAAHMPLPGHKMVCTSTSPSEARSIFSDAEYSASSVTSISEAGFDDKNDTASEDPVGHESADTLAGSLPFLNFQKPHEPGMTDDSTSVSRTESSGSSATTSATPTEENLELGLSHPAAQPLDLSYVDHVFNIKAPALSSPIATEKNKIASEAKPNASSQPRSYHDRPGLQLRRRWERFCAEKRVLALNINGKHTSAWPDTAGVNAMPLKMARDLGLGVDSTNKRLLRTAVLKTFETLGQVIAPVCFEEDTSRSQEVVFDVLDDFQWLPCLPEVTVGSKFLYENRLLDPDDRRYYPFTIRGLLVLLVWQEQEPVTMQHFLKVVLQHSGCGPVIEALLDTGSTFDAMSYACATEHFPQKYWRRQGSPSIRYPDGSETPSSGRIDATILVGDHRIQRTFIIVKGLAQDIVLGHEFWVTYSPFMTLKDHIRTDAPDPNDPTDHWPQDVNAPNRVLLRMGKWASCKLKPPAEPSESTLLRQRLEAMDKEEIKKEIFWARRALVVGKYHLALRKEGKHPELLAPERTTGIISFQNRSGLLAEPDAQGAQIEDAEHGDRKRKIGPAIQKAGTPGVQPDDRQQMVLYERVQGSQPHEAPKESLAEPAKGEYHETEAGMEPRSQLSIRISASTRPCSSSSRSGAQNGRDPPTTTPESTSARSDSVENNVTHEPAAPLPAFPSVPTGDPKPVVVEHVGVDMPDLAHERIPAT